MKAGTLVIPLILLVACTVPSAFAQQGVIFNYMIHVNFFTYSCTLSVAQVSLYDGSGNLVGVGSSPYGWQVEILIRSPVPVSVLTATATGMATWASYSWPVSGSGRITLGTIGDYWVTIRMS